MSEKLKVIIADDHSMFRDGLKLLLGQQDHLDVVGEAGNGNELVDMAFQHNPYLIITDIKMPGLNGIDASKKILQKYPEVCIIAMSMSDEESMVMDMIEAGAKGYLLKDADKKEILNAIAFATEGKLYFSQSLTAVLMKLAKVRRNKAQAKHPSFSVRELQIIRLICEEMTSRQIGESIYLSHKTVEYHRQRILEKMEVKSTIGIVVYSFRNKLVEF